MDVDYRQTQVFADRVEAGKLLAGKLLTYKNENPIILALPRGGVVLGYEIAKALHAPLNVIVARKIGLPMNPEFGIGAISEEHVMILDHDTINSIGIPEDTLQDLIQEQRIELDRRILEYRNGQNLRIAGQIVILVDDGLATGLTAKAAIEALKRLKVKKIIFASPICAYETSLDIQKIVAQTICLLTPFDMQAIGLWYRNFPQVTDEEVVRLLQEAAIYNADGYVSGSSISGA